MSFMYYLISFSFAMLKPNTIDPIGFLASRTGIATWICSSVMDNKQVEFRNCTIYKFEMQTKFRTRETKIL